MDKYVLVACECSQTVCNAFREHGAIAFSCDLLDCFGGHPEWHIQSDVLPLLNGHVSFHTSDGKYHFVHEWDLIIAHPPCTYLTRAGACNIPRDPSRIQRGFEAKNFFLKFLSADCPRICVENPIPMRRFDLPPYSQLFRAYNFGVSNCKPFCLWLRNLPVLTYPVLDKPDIPMVVWYHHSTGERKSCSKWYNTNTHRHSFHRSVFFSEIASAMASQWFPLL